MLKDLLGTIWRRAPKGVRRAISRFTNSRFTVTAGAVVLDDEKRVLLLKHVFRPGSGWGIPGGFIEAGEQPEAAVRRELREEVGIELESARLILVRTTATQKHIEVVFLCSAHQEPQPNSIEVTDARWFPINDLPPGLPEDQRRVISWAITDGGDRQN